MQQNLMWLHFLSMYTILCLDHIPNFYMNYIVNLKILVLLCCLNYLVQVINLADTLSLLCSTIMAIYQLVTSVLLANFYHKFCKWLNDDGYVCDNKKFLSLVYLTMIGWIRYCKYMQLQGFS